MIIEEFGNEYRIEQMEYSQADMILLERCIESSKYELHVSRNK